MKFGVFCAKYELFMVKMRKNSIIFRPENWIPASAFAKASADRFAGMTIENIQWCAEHTLLDSGTAHLRSRHWYSMGLKQGKITRNLFTGIIEGDGCNGNRCKANHKTR